jgi:ketol-acid reductoisomerase
MSRNFCPVRLNASFAVLQDATGRAKDAACPGSASARLFFPTTFEIEVYSDLVAKEAS